MFDVGLVMPRVNKSPAHIAIGPEGVIETFGKAATCTTTLSTCKQPAVPVIVTRYVPAAKEVTLEIDGVRNNEEKPFGPAQT